MLRVIGVGLMGFGVAGLLVFAGHIAWQELQTLRYVRRLDHWGEPARRASDDEWSQDIPEWR